MEADAPSEQMDEQQQQQPEQPSIATPDMVKASEKAALNVHKKLSVQAAPVRQYLESTVVPVVMQGMQALCKERPENPVEFLAYYLLSHNPQPSNPPAPSQDEQQAAAAAAAAAAAVAGQL